MLRLLFFLLLATQGVFAQKTFIHCGNLIDAKANDTQPQMTLVIEGSKIVAIEKGFSKPGKDDKLIDLSKKTVLPGLIDMHVHLEEETNKDQQLHEFTFNSISISTTWLLDSSSNLGATAHYATVDSLSFFKRARISAA